MYFCYQLHIFFFQLNPNDPLIIDSCIGKRKVGRPYNKWAK